MSDAMARPATLDDLKQLIVALNASGARYLLIGGYALAALGYVRATTDIDILVPADPAEGERVRNALLVLPEKVASDIDPAWFAEGDNIRVADAFVVDVMFNACGETWESLQDCAETVDLDGIPVRTLSAAGLLRTKQTVRPKDVADRLLLERVLKQVP